MNPLRTHANNTDILLYMVQWHFLFTQPDIRTSGSVHSECLCVCVCVDKECEWRFRGVPVPLPMAMGFLCACACASFVINDARTNALSMPVPFRGWRLRRRVWYCGNHPLSAHAHRTSAGIVHSMQHYNRHTGCSIATSDIPNELAETDILMAHSVFSFQCSADLYYILELAKTSQTKTSYCGSSAREPNSIRSRHMCGHGSHSYGNRRQKNSHKTSNKCEYDTKIKLKANPARILNIMQQYEHENHNYIYSQRTKLRQYGYVTLGLIISIQCKIDRSDSFQTNES